MGRAPQDIRTCHEGCRGPAMAWGTNCEQLFLLSAATCLCAVSHIDAVKRSMCIEGARMALARVKTYWAKMKATNVATGGPPGGQDTPDQYFEEVLEGALLIEGQCSKNIMFK